MSPSDFKNQTGAGAFPEGAADFFGSHDHFSKQINAFEKKTRKTQQKQLRMRIRPLPSNAREEKRKQVSVVGKGERTRNVSAIPKAKRVRKARKNAANLT